MFVNHVIAISFARKDSFLGIPLWILMPYGHGKEIDGVRVHCPTPDTGYRLPATGYRINTPGSRRMLQYLSDLIGRYR